MADRGGSEEKEQLEYPNDTNETTQMTASLEIEIAEKFWSNDIIWQEITSYLSISDLKDFSCVNNYFLNKVRCINGFTRMAGQVIKRKLKIHVFKLCRAIVLANKIDAKALQENAPQIFQDTEYLEIHCLRKLSYGDRNSRLIQIISNCPKLKSLALGRYNFLWNNIEYFLKHSTVKLILSKLKELHLEFYNHKYISDKDRYDQLHGSIKEPESPSQSFHLLSELQMSLVKFSYQGPQGEFPTCFFSAELVLRSSQNTLVELNLDVPFGSTLGLQNMKFPTLEKFRLTLNNANSYTGETFKQQTFDMNFTKFLKNHLLSLTQFELDSPEFDISFSAVCEVLKLSKKIRVLWLGREDRREFDFDTRVTIVIGNEWENFANISNLRSLNIWTGMFQNDFFLHWNRSCNLTNFNRYVECLRPNTNSFTFWGQCWKDWGNANYFVDTVQSAFMKFQNLVELTLFAFLNDEIIQFICKHLTKLLVFEGDFTEVSDYGISGKRERDNYDSGVSIANIKGLRRLHMYAATPDMDFNMTWTGLLQSVHFLELVDLKVKGKLKNNNSLMNSDLHQDNQRNCLRLISKSRNPSLEKVSLIFYKPDKSEIENIRRVNPRTKFYREDRGFF